MDATASDAKILLERLFLRYVTSSSNVDGGTIVIGSSVTNGGADGAVVADDATSTKGAELSFAKRSFQNCLEPRGWLNQDNIFAFLYALDELSGSKSVELGNPATVYTSRNPAADANTVFIPLNWDKIHWTLGVVSRSPGAKESTFRHHDSLPKNGRPKEAFDIVKRKFGAENEMVFDEVTSSVEQQDGSSCGLYVCLYATLETFWPGHTLTGSINPKDLTTFREKMRDANVVYTVIDTVRFTPEAASDLITFAKEVVKEKLSDARPVTRTTTLDVSLGDVSLGDVSLGDVSLGDDFFNSVDFGGVGDGHSDDNDTVGQAGGGDSDGEDSVIDGSFATSIGGVQQNSGASSRKIDRQLFSSGPVPERKKVWSSIHDIASGADALFGLGPFAGRENPPPRPRAVDDADPVLLEAQMWLNA